MNRKRIYLVLAAVLVLSACNLQAASGGAPQAWIDDPLDGTRLLLQKPYTIAFHGSDAAGISQMEVSVNGEVLATLQNPESTQLLVYLTQVWEPQKPGRYVIRVRAQNNAGTWSEPDLVTVEVEEATPTPEVTLTPTATVTLTPTSTQAIGFLGEPVFTPRQINLPYDCPTTPITAEVRVTSTQGIKGVALFFRVADRGFAERSEWANIAMNLVGADTYRATFDPIIEGSFKPWLSTHWSSPAWEGWLQTQFVIQDTKGTFTRSEVFGLVMIGGCN